MLRSDPMLLTPCSDQIENVPGTEVGKLIRTPDRTITWIAPWQYKNVKSSTAVGVHSPNLRPPRQISPFDIRAIPLYLWADFGPGMDFDELYDSLVKSQWIYVVKETKVLYRIRRTLGTSGCTQTIWIDASQGFSPIRLEVHLVVSPETGKDEQLLQTSETSWKQVSDTWVPLTYRIEDREVHGKLMKCELAFNWLSVNQSVDAKLFDPKGLDVPQNTPLVDYRMGKPLIIGRVGEGGESAHRPKFSNRSYRLVFILITTITAIAALAWWYRQKTRKGITTSRSEDHPS